MGGEHSLGLSITNIASGSSPRGRGTQAIHRHGIEFLRVIPAWAGNTATRRSRAGSTTGHPRVGGEHCADLKLQRRLPGHPRVGGEHVVSSVTGHPRVGGEHTGSPRAHSASNGSSPWAGNTTSLFVSTTTLTGHRVGGEHYSTAHDSRRLAGSSPRGRGTPTREALCRYPPTGHPRVGGEHSNCKQLICREFTACKRATEQYTRFGDAI